MLSMLWNDYACRAACRYAHLKDLRRVSGFMRRLMLKYAMSATILSLIVVTLAGPSFPQTSQSLSALLRRGQRQLDSGDFSQAIQTYEVAVQLAPENEAAFSGFVYSLLKAKQLSRAVAFGQQATVKWSNSPELHHWLGLAYFQSGDLSAGEEQLARAVALKANDYDSVFDLSLIRLAKKDYSKAATSLETALRLRSTEAMPHLLLGRAYLNSNRTLKAIEQFKTAARLNPNLPLVHYHLGYAYESLGRCGEAIEQYRKELARDNNNAEVLGQLGCALGESGAWHDASEYLKRALEIQPARAEWLYALAKTYLRLEELENSLQLLKRYIEQRPTDPSGHYLLSQALEKSGHREEAKLEMEKFQETSKSQQRLGASASSPR